MQQPDCREVPHALGTTQVCGTPTKVVVLGDHSLDLLLSLGQQPAGFGSTIAFHQGEVFDQPEEQIPYLGQFVTTQPVNVGSGSQPSLEILAQLQPDLIVGEVGPNRENYGLLSQIAPTMLWDVRTYRGRWQQNFRALAQALGEEQNAEAAIAKAEQRMAETRRALTPIVGNQPTALLLGAHRLGSGDIFVITPNSFLGELMDGLGFELIAPASTTNSIPLSLEALPELGDVDYVFVLGYDRAAKAPDPDQVLQQQTSGIQQDWTTNAIAQSLSASKADQVYFSTYLLWNGLNGPIGIDLILDELQQWLLPDVAGPN